MKKTKVYLAYAKVLGSAELPGYRLLFRGGSERSSVATVEPCDGMCVPAVLWEITPECEAALDVYEGYPNLYRKETVSVKLNGKIVKAMVYVMNPRYGLGIPSEYYFNAIVAGYKSAGLNTDYLVEAVRHSAVTYNWYRTPCKTENI
jgi:gamma-glutamylcyclotransferase (GGCT)/AIG2-like uncharacterized protein YtfP